MTFKNLITNLKSLPPLSNTPYVIQQIYSVKDQDIDIIKLVKTIENDAVLAANILKMINAPIYGFSRKISSISQAVTLFGTDEIYGLVLRYSIAEQLKADTSIYGVEAKIFNDVCHLQSSLMLQWYSTIDIRHAQVMAPLALIMESGKLVLSNEVMKSNYIKEFTKGYKNAKNIQEFEHEVLGTTTYYLTGILFEHWKLDSLYVDILKGLDFEANVSPKVESYIDSIDVVRTAVNMRSILTKESILDACDIVDDIGLDMQKFYNIANRVREQYNRVLIKRMQKN